MIPHGGRFVSHPLSIGTARRLLVALTLLVAGATLALHVPGHVSMDSSIQLYEAHTGQSVSWNPPFMSALMRWLGGGETATAALVFLQVVLLYGALLSVADTLLSARQAHGMSSLPAWRLLPALAVVLNPVIALYAGIVWKDVLFGALLAAGVAAALAAVHRAGIVRWVSAGIALLVFAAALQTRQQGVFMVPVLLATLLAGCNRRNLLAVGAAVVVGFGVVAALLQHEVSATVRDSGSRSTSVGFRSIMIFDMMGIVARSDRPADELAWSISARQKQALQQVYQPSRIDYIAQDPVAESSVATLTPDELRTAWWSLVRQDPVAYVAHRAAAFATLLGLRGVEATLPIHVGVSGNSEYLGAVGLREGIDVRDQLAYRVAMTMSAWPFYRHAFWLAVLAACTMLAFRSQLLQPQRRVALCIATAAGLFYLSFIPTMISSDFRYLFGAIPLVGLLVLLLTFGTRETCRT